ncbi:hypothetical protein PFISCL1PPCAC_13390, partial [Pristionchus fissidentatus]
MNSHFIWEEECLALPRMRRLTMRMAFCEEPIWDPEMETFLDVIKKRHTIIDATIAEIESGQDILDIVKLVVDYDRSQCVIFKTSFGYINDFMQLLGYHRTEYDQEFKDRFEHQRNHQAEEVVHDELLNGRWSGEFELSY